MPDVMSLDIPGVIIFSMGYGKWEMERRRFTVYVQHFLNGISFILHISRDMFIQTWIHVLCYRNAHVIEYNSVKT